jgi:hypothetical protein
MTNTLKKFIDIQVGMLDLPQTEVEIIHHHAPGLYCREMRVKQGVVVMGKIHKTEHLNILSQGTVIVATPEGDSVEHTAPCMVHSLPGTKRILYAVTDYTWTNIHHNPTNEQDEDKIEDIFIDDYTGFLLENNLDMKLIQSAVENVSDINFVFVAGIELKKSLIHGKGSFTTRAFKVGDKVGPARIDGKRTQLGRYVNHSPNPNVKISVDGSTIDFEAVKDIQTGDEITVNYRDNFQEVLP